MFLAVFIGFINYLAPVVIIGECDLLINSDSARIVAIFSIERLVTHFAPISFSIFVFWQSRQNIETPRVSIIQHESSKSLSMMDMEYNEGNLF